MMRASQDWVNADNVVMQSASSRLSHMLTPQRNAPPGIGIQPANHASSSKQLLFKSIPMQATQEYQAYGAALHDEYRD